MQTRRPLIGEDRSASTRLAPRTVLVKRPYLLLLPIGLAIGYGSGQLAPKGEVSQTATPTAGIQAPVNSPTAANRVDLWRSRFLKLLEEPSFSLQCANYYAVARELTVEDMPFYLEAMYPEGWARFRGDLPIAIYMEWAKRDSRSLPAYTEQLLQKYPDLKDNFSALYFNLGLQNSPGAVESIAGIAHPDTRQFLADRFINGLRDAHPEQLFPARLKLLGPQTAFSYISSEELSQAVEAYWTLSATQAGRDIQPHTSIALEIGRRYREQGIQRFADNLQQAAAIVGSIVATGTLSEPSQTLLAERWFNWNDIENYLSKGERRSLLSFLSRQDEYWQENKSGIGPKTIETGLDREIAERLLRQPSLSSWTRNYILAEASQLYSRDEYFRVLQRFDSNTVEISLSGLVHRGSARESLELLESIPATWRSEGLISKALEKSLWDGDPDTFKALCSRYPEHQTYLPQDRRSANALWHLDPELYLKNIESAQGNQKYYQLEMIAATADEEELGFVLESASLEQQTDVLISLIQEKPALSTEILKHEDPSLLNQYQATQIGSALAYQASPEVALSYFQASDLSHPNSQVAMLSYCQYERQNPDGSNPSREIAKLSATHDYIYRTAAAFGQETDDPEPLLALRRENPEIFLNAFTSMLSRDYDNSLKNRAQRLLSSSTLSQSEKLEIHRALYGNRIR